MNRTTRDQLLDSAEALFAERGFYGASIAAIAERLDLTKQALLHYFSTKEKLYGAVLERISSRFIAQLSDPELDEADPAEHLRRFFLAVLSDAKNDEARTQLLMRELLDNRARAGAAGTWYLKPFLEQLVDLYRQTPAGQGRSVAQAQAAVYQLLGAINYFAVSEPTLTGILGKKPYREMAAAFDGEFAALVDRVLR